HGEHGAIVRAFTEQEGVQPGYVRGGHGRALRPVLQPANLVQGEWRSRTEDALAGLTVELLHSRAAMFSEALPAAAFQWATALSAFALPEGLPYPRLY
ncbi:recombination protein O N-terminal domain-containing protein, partial [Escherichia coli]|nr:recombination protein O N-terminal domain-containing protein [Escherichia coli]